MRAGIYLESANFRFRGRFDYDYSPFFRYIQYNTVKLPTFSVLFRCFTSGERNIKSLRVCSVAKPSD